MKRDASKYRGIFYFKKTSIKNRIIIKYYLGENDLHHYVYRYIHPDDPWLYVGKTDRNLRRRIYEHDFEESDNIDRKYREELHESSVYYVELENRTQSDYVEKYLIDRYKPTLNIKDKHEDSGPVTVMEIPKWKKYIREFELKNFLDLNSKLHKDLKAKKKELEEIEKLIKERRLLLNEKEIQN